MDRSLAVGLTDQLERALRFKISSGEWQSGRRLPSLVALARQAGVSEKVSRQAVTRLVRNGWIVARSGAPSVVAERGFGKETRGCVLIFTTIRYCSYYFTTLFSSLRDSLAKAGLDVSVVMTGRPGGNEFEPLAKALTQPWNLIIECGEEKASRQMIENSGVPFVVLGNGGRVRPSVSSFYVGKIDVSGALALPDLVRACVRKGVRSVLQLVLGRCGVDAADMLRVADIRTETLSIGYGDLDQIMNAAVQAMLKRIDGGRPLPDLVLFTDDYLARGGLLALASRGVRVPEDVRVVTFSVKGHRPVWTDSLARLEMDPVAHAAKIVRIVRTYFRTRTFSCGQTLGTVWRSGVTF